MSLQLAAQHLSSQGRGGDSTLVHMSPREVKSLNDLAMAHGGQLSINPQTGLPEAGFLSSILPMVAGFALGPAGFGLSAAQAGLAAGALGFAMTGSLGKGLMAGLGAYGGAGIGEGLASTAVDAAPGIAEAQKLAQTQQMELANKFYDPTSGLRSGFAEADYLKQAQDLTKGQMDAMATARTGAEGAYKDLGFMEKMGKNFETLTAPGGFGNVFDKISGSPMSLLKTVGSAAAPAASEAMKPKTLEEEKADTDMGQRYGFSMNPAGGQRQVQPGQDPLANTSSPTTTPFPTPDIYGREQSYFSPSYTKLTPEQAKSMYGYADGGVAQSNAQPATEPFPMPRFTNEGKQPSGETPALQMFRQMQAQRAAQPPVPQIDANAQFQDYLKRTVNPPKQAQASTTPPSTTTGDGFVSSLGLSENPFDYSNLSESEKNRGGIYGSATAPKTYTLSEGIARLEEIAAKSNPSSEFIYDPAKQTYTKNPNFAATPDEPAADAFNVENRPVVGYTATGEKIYGEKKGYGMGGMGQNFRTFASGGMSNLGDYSDGGRLLRGPGDGVSDSIPAMIGKKQPARLADGEFVVPARIVSEIGNGSTEAGARKLYAMMDRVQAARRQTVGKGKVAKNSRADKYLPA